MEKGIIEKNLLNCNYFACRGELSDIVAIGIQPSGEMLVYCDSVCASFARVEEQKNLKIITLVPLPEQKYYI